jgi:hypothetical protein
MRISKLSIVLWAVSLLGVGLVAQSTGPRSFRVAPDNIQELDPHAAANPILSGDDIGFQLDSGPSSDGTASGRLVVRVNGKWIVATAPMTLHPARR